jgi:hypothetical protein
VWLGFGCGFFGCFLAVKRLGSIANESVRVEAHEAQAADVLAARVRLKAEGFPHVPFSGPEAVAVRAQ